MRDCPRCPTYNNGYGTRTCLKCPQYKRFQVKFAPRPQIPIDIVPDAIMVELTDTAEQMPVVLEAIKHLPDDLSLIIVGRHIAGISQLSMAAVLRTSERQIRRREAIAMSCLKKMLRKEIM